MIDGCVDWQERGLAPPEAVTAATAAYLDAQDTIAAWLDECCELDANAWERSQTLFASWKAWAERSGQFVGDTKTFRDRLDGRDGIELPRSRAPNAPASKACASSHRRSRPRTRIMAIATAEKGPQMAVRKPSEGVFRLSPLRARTPIIRKGLPRASGRLAVSIKPGWSVLDRKSTPSRSKSPTTASEFTDTGHDKTPRSQRGEPHRRTRESEHDRPKTGRPKTEPAGGAGVALLPRSSPACSAAAATGNHGTRTPWCCSPSCVGIISAATGSPSASKASASRSDGTAGGWSRPPTRWSSAAHLERSPSAQKGKAAYCWPRPTAPRPTA